MKVKIEKLISGGWGLARANGKVIFVPYVLPEEVVEVRIFEEKKNYAFAELIEIITASSQRKAPVCPYFGICGGCDYQHMPYNSQLQIKIDLFKEEINRQLPETDIKEIIPATEPLFYRNRLYLKVKKEGHYEVQIGFYKKHTHKLVSVEKCFLAIPEINDMLPILKETLQAHAAIVHEIRGIEIFFSPDEEKGIIILHTLVDFSKRHLKSMAEKLLDLLPTLKDVLIKHAGFVYPRSLIDKGYTESALFFEIDGLKIFCYPGVFFQVNTNQNKELISVITNMVNLVGNEKVLELYAGVGNLSLPLAKKVKSLIGLENNGLAVKNANYNAQRNKIRALFKKVDVDREIKKFLKTDDYFDCLVVDPPRQGCIRALKDILDVFSPQKIIYVSCHPATLARDLKYLTEKGYKIDLIQPIDMFPQTQHIESITLAIA